MMDEREDGEVEQFAELAGLGVTVRDRQEFEDGLMRQLDLEAAKRNFDQQKRFTEKELVDVKKEIEMVGVELGNLDKTIGALIKLPLFSIAAKLRDAKSQKELKDKQLQKLRARELALITKLENNNFNEGLEQAGDDRGSDDIAFGISVAPGNKEMADLIQHGYMTPFGGQIIEGVNHDSIISVNSTIPSNSANTMTFDEVPSQSITPDDSTLINTDYNYEIPDELQIHDNGMLDTPSEAVRKGEVASAEMGNEASDGSDDAFVPNLNDDFYYSTSDSYITDDEGTSHRTSRVKRYRQMVSSESDDDVIHTNKVKRKKTGVRRRSHTSAVDDGDDQLYKLRVREMEAVNDDETFEDMRFPGGLRIPGRIWQRLYKYQRTGVQWLWELHSQQAGGIVGDEMGLGKTIQLIAFLAGLSVSKVYSNVTRCRGLGPVLIVCPATVLHQWVREFHTWWAPFRVAVMHSTGSFQGNKATLVNRMTRCNAMVITTYHGVRLYRDILLRQQWDYVVLDEGHKIRNPDADITLTCKQFSTPHKIILSGSPMQNNLKELWSLFDFVFPGKLGTLPVFLEQFSVPITMGGYSTATKIQVQTAYRCACVLRDTISPYLLRRHKADVKIHLPPKNEQVLFCRLTSVQREMYEDYLKSPELSDMLVGRTKVFSGISTLRKLCNHPDLVGAYRNPPNFGSHDPSERLPAGYDAWDSSGKMIVVVSLLKAWHSMGHRVLLFSQTRKMLLILEEFLRSKGYTYLKMDGTTPVASRQHLINSFNQDNDIFVFLLTTRVGGLGVNLTGADRVVIYDPDWNPSTDTQARERAWRIGQDKQVTIYRLLTTGTIEEKIYHRQIFKQFLTNRILRDPRQRRLFKTNDLYDLFTLGSDDTPGSETGSLFTGTGSEVKVARKGKSSKNTSNKEKSKQNSTSSDLYHSSSSIMSSSVQSHSERSCDPSNSSSRSHQKLKSLEEIRRVWQTELFGNSNAHAESSHTPDASCDANSTILLKHKKRKHISTLVDGAAIAGVERCAVYEQEQVEKENKEENDSVLRMLIKKTGLHSAFQHDSMVDGGDPDYVLMESEAQHVAQSAARALLQSREQCHASSGWGLPTWTGQNGVAGRPSMSQQRFGSNTEKSPIAPHHNTTETGGDDMRVREPSGSANVSSDMLLCKIHKRNAHKDGTNMPIDTSKVEQLREIRDFIACQCSKDGQATTNELIGRFSGSNHESNQSTFKSMLQEICEFYREDGTGIWRLKPNYRY